MIIKITWRTGVSWTNSLPLRFWPISNTMKPRYYQKDVSQIFRIFLNINCSLHQTLLTFLLYVGKTWMTQLTGKFSVSGYLALIWKGYITQMHGLAVYVKKGLPFARDLSLENSGVTVCSYHATYAFQSEFTLYSCLNVKEFFAQSRLEIWSLSDCNWTRTHNHLVHKDFLGKVHNDIWGIANSGLKKNLYLLYSLARRYCLLYLTKQNCLLKTFLRSLILKTEAYIYLFSLLELTKNCIILL